MDFYTLIANQYWSNICQWRSNQEQLCQQPLISPQSDEDTTDSEQETEGAETSEAEEIEAETFEAEKTEAADTFDETFDETN